MPRGRRPFGFVCPFPAPDSHLRAEVEGRGLSFAATWSGKWKMILQSICVPTVLILMNFRGEQGHAPGENAGYAILGKAAPPFVALPALPVSQNNVLAAWDEVYRRPPPDTLALAGRRPGGDPQP